MQSRDTEQNSPPVFSQSGCKPRLGSKLSASAANTRGSPRLKVDGQFTLKSHKKKTKRKIRQFGVNLPVLGEASAESGRSSPRLTTVNTSVLSSCVHEPMK